MFRKTIFVLLLSIAMLQICTAQQTATSQASSRGQLLAERYQLSNSQQSKVIDIELRKFEALKKVESLKVDDPPRYRQKVRAIYKGTRNSFRIILTKEQEGTFNLQQRNYRKAKAERSARLKANGAGQTEIENAIIELEEQSY